MEKAWKRGFFWRKKSALIFQQDRRALRELECASRISTIGNMGCLLRFV